MGSTDLTERLRAMLARGETEIRLSAEDLAFCRGCLELVIVLDDAPVDWVNPPASPCLPAPKETRFTLHWRHDGSAVAVLIAGLDALHPTGRCSCAGSGKCGWCTSIAPCGCERSACPGHE